MLQALKKNWIQLLSIAVTLICGLSPVFYGAYRDALSRKQGDRPTLELTLDRASISDPALALSRHGDTVELALSVQGEHAKSIRIASTTLINSGAAPIEPASIHEPLSITTAPPWRLAAVESPAADKTVGLSWHRVSPLKFETEKFLLNPDDRASITAYLVSDEATPDPGQPDLKFDARIVNLKNITTHDPREARDQLLAEIKRETGSVIVFLSGPRLNWCIALFLVFYSLNLFFAFRGGVLPLQSVGQTCAALSVLSLLCFAAAESTLEYTYPTTGSLQYLYFLGNVAHPVNVPILLLHTLVLCSFLIRYRQRLEGQDARASAQADSKGSERACGTPTGASPPP